MQVRMWAIMVLISAVKEEKSVCLILDTGILLYDFLPHFFQWLIMQKQVMQ